MMLSQSKYVSVYVSIWFRILHLLNRPIPVAFLVSDSWLLSSTFPYLSFLFNPNLQDELLSLFPLTELKFCVQLLFIITSVLGIPHTNRLHPHDVDIC